MRVGVVCEGRTDFPAIVQFVGSYLINQGIEVEFRPLYPEMDRTRPDGGWANVLLWLAKNGPDLRIQKYFGGGLFGGDLAVEPLQAILVHLDSDVVDDESFNNYVERNLGYRCNSSDDPIIRGKEISRVLDVALRSDDLAELDLLKHVKFVAVESTETWCVAAFNNEKENWEMLRGQDLVNQFMSALERSEGRQPKHQYSKANKNYRRRSQFCEKHAVNVERVVVSCDHFRISCAKLQEAISA